MNCRHCRKSLHNSFLDLGFAPPSNAYLSLDDLSKPELYYPLRVKVCDRCWLVQTEDYAERESLFTSDYAYFSSTSTSWLSHSENFVHSIVSKLSLDANSLVIEVGCNDGYLLKNFISLGVPCLGIEPTSGTADAAELCGISVLREFFGADLATRLGMQGRKADLIIGNNVFAHVPDINDFTMGLKNVLKPGGTITLEFPHLLELVEKVQFDTVYHEHFSYLSLRAVRTIFASAGLRIWDVERIATHGGSLRVYGCHEESERETQSRVAEILVEEEKKGLLDLWTYQAFQGQAERVKNELLRFLITQKKRGKRVVGYGAAAKGSTLLNFGGVKPDLLPVVYDAAPSKQGKYLPGSHIPILNPAQLETDNADFVLILPWNIAHEVRSQQAGLAKRGTIFVTAVPGLTFVE